MELRRLCDSTDAAWEMVWTLYEAAFPLCERRGRKAFEAALSDESFHCMVVYDKEPIGFLTWWDIGDCLYLEHFAMLPNVRGRGYGQAVLEQVKHLGRRLLLEAEMPHEEIAARRIGFYKRAGFIENEHRHLQPPYHGERELLEMRVMTYPVAVSPAEYHRAYASIWQIVTGETLKT